MARPRAIYASVPPGATAMPLWIESSETSIPVQYSKPYADWPDLNWLGNLYGDNSPTDYGLETPQYLWSDRVVKHPEAGETHTFSRRWNVGGPRFTPINFPPGDYLVVITHGADDEYRMILEAKGAPMNPLGANSFILHPNTWRNVMTYVYRLILTPNDKVTLTSIVTNSTLPTATPESNPAMFTWVMQVFDSSVTET